MEVFPLEDAVQGEVAGPSVSQVEQMKSWDASFAQLEKMLQAACETEASPDDADFSNHLSPMLTTSGDTEATDDLEAMSKSPIERDNKRKRCSSESASSDDDLKAKILRTNKILPEELTLTLIEPKENSEISDDVSKLASESGPSSPVRNSVFDVQSEKETETFEQVSTETQSKSDEVHDLNFNEETDDTVRECENSSLVSDEKGIAPDENESSCSSNYARPSQFDDSEDIKADFEHSDSSAKVLHSISSNQGQECFKDNDFEANDQNDVCNEQSGDVDSEHPSTESSEQVEGDEITANGQNPKELSGSSDKATEDVSSNSSEKLSKKEKKDEFSEKSSKKDDKSKKKKFERCNIRDIKLDEELDAVTLSAQKEEQERIKRLQEAQMRALQERLQIIEVEKEALSQLFSNPPAEEESLFNSATDSVESSEDDDKSKIPLIKSETDVILLESADATKANLQKIIPGSVESEENIIDISSSSSDGESDTENDSDKKDDEVLVLSDEGEAETDAGPEDPNNSGAHTNDCFNLPDHEGRVLVNVGHPPEDPDIYLAPQIAKVIKPHQIGGIRFLYDNVVENLERYKSSSGFGCILAHSMGLGKTVQVVSFVDVFLRHTPATLVLCIVPINTIQNWKAEFDMWVPPTASVDNEQIISGEVRPRDYNVYTLNENFKTMSARASLIAEWRADGGVLLMGYEMYRMLALRKMPKIPVKKCRRLRKQDMNVEPETTEQIKKFMDQMYEHIVIPGPDLVICDEGHRIKNSLASTSMALKSIKTRRRVVLTGYPLQNNLLEYWCMVDFVRPNYLGSRAEFCNMFERPISNGQCIDSTPRDRQLMRFRSHVLHSLLVGFVQRRGHSVLRAVLPKKEEHVLLIRMTPIQRKLYRCFVKDLLHVQQATNPLKLFAVCCKIWNHPDILYKLLQEKRAQEDIDLDIDLSTGAPGSSLSGSNVLMKRKGSAKDQMKSKAFQRALKIEPLKMQAGDIGIQKSDSLSLPSPPCQMGAPLSIKTENNASEINNDQNGHRIREQVQIPEVVPQLCKEEYSSAMHSSVNVQHSQNMNYSHSPLLHDGHKSNSYVQSQYSQQTGSFCQASYSQNAGLDQCQTQLPKSSSQYLQQPSVQPQHQQYPTQSSQPMYMSSPLSQYQHQSQTSFSQASSNQNYPAQANGSSQSVSQQYAVTPPSAMEQGFASQAATQENFHQPIPQFSQTNLQQQQYSQQFAQQSPASQSKLSFSQEPPTQQFSMQQSSQPVSSQIAFAQQSKSSQQFSQTAHQQYSQPTVAQNPSQSYSSATPPVQQQQYSQQASQKFSDHSAVQHHSYSENSPHQQYSEQSDSENQKCHEQSPSQPHSYSEPPPVQQQFTQPSSLQQQPFSQSSASHQQQFPQRPQSGQQSRSQQSFSQAATTLDTQSPFSHPSPNPKVHQQSSPQQHYTQQPSPQFAQQSSPMQSFSQCSPSQQQQFSQPSPPLQQSPNQQYSLPSPTQQQTYPPTYSQPSPNHQQYLPQQQQPSHQYPQVSSPQQQFAQGQYSHKSPSQQCTQQSSPQQQFPQPSKQTYSQQYMQHGPYPRQPSPQHFVQQPRQTSFSTSHQPQQYSHQTVQQYKTHMAPQTSFSQQTSHSQFSSVSPQPANQGQQFNSSAAHTAGSLQFNQQGQLPSSQQFSTLQQPDHYALQMTQTQSNSPQLYNKQTVQNVSSPQYTQPPVKVQFSQSSQQSTSQSFVMSSSLSSQSQQAQQCHQGLQSKQYQHPFPQQQNQNQPGSQSSFKQQFPSQVQPSMHQGAMQNSSKQASLKGKSKQTAVQPCNSLQQQACDNATESAQPQQYSHQTFQSSSLEQVLSQPQQNVIPTQSVSSPTYPPIHSALTKKENFGVENMKDETNVVYPSKCPKAVLRPLKQQTNICQAVLPYPQGPKPHLPMQEVLKSENEQTCVVSNECVTVSCRDRIDSSISYEWALPLMKDYILGVLENSHKMMVLFSIIDQTVRKKDKLLVFSQSLSTLDLLEHFLGKVKVPASTDVQESIVQELWCRNKNYFRLDGSTSAQEREKLINEFNRNENVPLFLLSTRAGCLGINLVGANRIVVMDASWNPCHDAQAVCRIYRYGQKKQCHIYRLVTDNSLEKRIYDRQVNKQGMSDRVVDELNPESNFTWKDVTTLIQDDEDDGPAQELLKFEESYTDDVLKFLVSKMSPSLSKEPFEHESLLLDRKELKLTKQEKRLAKQSYEMAKRANMINIRTTYTYMPGGGQFIINNKQCQWVGGTAVRVLPGQTMRGCSGAGRGGTTATPITASPSLMNSLFKQGVMVQKLTIPSNISIPVLTPGAPPVVVPAGQDVLVLRTPKGVYLRLPDGRIIAVQLPPSLLAKTQFRPNVVTHFRPNVSKGNQNPIANAPRGQSIGIIKQTLQCGGTVRYLGPKNTSGQSPQSSCRGSAPEIIDLSDDDEPSTKKGNLHVAAESESVSLDSDHKLPTSILQGKQITIRRVSPNSQQNTIQLPSSKDKCDLPLKLQQNQQITIMPINPSVQQNRQKVAPQLAQPVRVQQMLLQPQQGKKKPLPKNTSKLQLSPLSLAKSLQRPQITVTPTQPGQLQKSRQSALSSFPMLNKPSDMNDQCSEQQMISAVCSPPQVPVTEALSKTEINAVTSEHEQSSHLESKDVTNSFLPVSTAGQSVLASDVSICSVSQNSMPGGNPLSCVSEPMSVSATEVTQRISNLLPQTSISTSCSQSHNVSIQSTLTSQVISGSGLQNSHPSVTGSETSLVPSKPLPQISNPADISSPSSLSLSSCLPQDTLFPDVQSQTNILSNPQPESRNQISHSNIQQLSQASLSHQTESEVFQSEKCAIETAEVRSSSSLAVPKLSNSLSETPSKVETLQPPVVQVPKTQLSEVTVQPKLSAPCVQPPPQHVLENPQNGQLHSDLNFMPQHVTQLQQQHHSRLQPISLPQGQHHPNSKKKKSSRQTSRKSQQLHSHANLQSSQQQSQVSDTHHPFSHSSITDHLHEHHFQPFSHHLQSSEFQPFPSYTAHKPLLHIQHPQPVHPLQHSQEHPLASHLPHVSHLYPMATHMTGNPSLSNIQPQAWPVPQSSMSSFHPFGQSSQYYSSSHESNQFPFQPSSFTIPQPAAAHAPQSESNNARSGLEHASSACSSEL